MENLITVSKKRPVSFSRKGSDYMNFRSLFLIFVVIVLMCGSASATDYYDAFNTTFESGSTLSANMNANFTTYPSEVELFPFERYTTEGVTNQSFSGAYRTVYAKFDQTNSSSQQYWGIYLYNSSDASNTYYRLYRYGNANYDRYNGETHSYLSGSDGTNDVYIYAISQNDTHIDAYASFDGGDNFILLNSTETTSFYDSGGIYYANAPSTIYYQTAVYDYMFLGSDSWNGSVYDSDEEIIPLHTPVEYHANTSSDILTMSQALLSGDTLYLGGGTYNTEGQNRLNIKASGNATHHITITSEPGETPIIHGNFTDYYGLDVDDGEDYIVISNITFNNSAVGIWLEESNNITVNNCTITHTYGSAVSADDCNDITITNNNISSNGWNSIAIESSYVDVKNINITANEISKNPGTTAGIGAGGHNFIDLYNSMDNGKIISNITIKNNYLHDLTSDYAIYSHKYYGIYNVSILNNHFYNTTRILTDYFDGQSIIKDNLFENNLYVPIYSGNFFCYNITIENNTDVGHSGYAIDLTRAVSPLFRNNNASAIRAGSYFVIDLIVDDSQRDFNFVMYNSANRTHEIKSSTSKIFWIDGYNTTYYPTESNLTISGNVDVDVHWQNNYSLYSSSSVVATETNVNGITLFSTSEQNITFQELSTGNTSTVQLATGNTNIVFANLDFSGDDGLHIIGFIPTDTTPSSTAGTEQTFTATFNKTVDSAEWLINGNHMEWDNSTLTASYSNSTALPGVYNVTVIATDGVTEVSQTWIWTVSEDHGNEFVAVVFAGLSFVGLYFANRFRRR
jgi:parallel beta-helix repeat protein